MTTATAARKTEKAFVAGADISELAHVSAMQQPEVYIGNADKLFDEHDKLVNDGTRKFLQEFVQAFASWIERMRPAYPASARAAMGSG
jgi:enoyl-CoA hydratase/carnithine racemase